MVTCIGAVGGSLLARMCSSTMCTAISPFWVRERSVIMNCMSGELRKMVSHDSRTAARPVRIGPSGCTQLMLSFSAHTAIIASTSRLMNAA